MGDWRTSDYTNWYEEPNNFEGLEHYAAMWPWQSGGGMIMLMISKSLLIEYIPNDMPEEPMVEGT